MRTGRVLVSLLAVALLVASPAFAQQPSEQQDAAQPSQAAISNEDILDLLKAGIAADVIIAKIKSSPCSFDTSPSALEALRGANVPNEVILAMVNAPVAKDSTQPNIPQPQPTQSPLQQHRSYLGLLVVPASPAGDRFVVRTVIPDGPAALAGIQEGDIVEAVNGHTIASVSDYQNATEGLSRQEPGTQVTFRILRKGQERTISATTVPPSPELVTVVKSIAYKSLPYYSKTVYQISPGSSMTTCNGATTGEIYANAQPNYAGGANINGTVNTNTNTNCYTTYHPPQQGEINWRIVYNYNLVEGNGYRFVLLCTASVRWSKCAHLVPGAVFPVQVKGSQMWITANKNGNLRKVERIKYNILQVAPIN